MFDFRIIEPADGNQVIDMTLKTPYESLTPFQMVEYEQMARKLAIMDRMERKAREQEKRQRKLARNPFYRLACIVGLL